MSAGISLFTSYYGARRRLPDHAKWVSISLDGGRVAKFEGRVYRKLAPTPAILHHWHEHHDIGNYKREFAKVLAKLDPHAVAAELGDGTVLMCYERAKRAHMAEERPRDEMPYERA